ncbi:MAG: DUF1016 N-terminal domain-containing protein [Candidatus Omnitrophota bacterium]|jgi:endonuclease YncB( thermonuclease family)
MKKAALFSFLLMFFLVTPAALRAETPAAEKPQALPEVKTSPVPKKVVGTAYDKSALTALPGNPGLSSNRGTTVEQARRSDDFGQSSTATEALPEVKTYEELRHAISQTRAISRVRVEKAVEQERVREAWEIGRLIDAHVLQHKERADYGKQVLLKLAKDLGMSDTELGYMLRFARAYPISQPAGKLSWSHYMELLSLNDVKEQNKIADMAEKEKWTRDQIREEVKKRKAAMHETPMPVKEIKLTAQPGKPWTYKIILAKTGPYAGELAIDLGFSNYVRLAEVVKDMGPFKEGDVLEFSDEEGKILKSKEANLYTYEAWVTRVLDGDTVEAVVDLGFGITTIQTLRLRGIDAPEIQTRDGMEAKEFVEKMLEMPGDGERGTQAKAGALVLIKTFKSDKYDRYLADVFLSDAKGQEDYLNNQLLEKGYAVIVDG